MTDSDIPGVLERARNGDRDALHLLLDRARVRLEHAARALLGEELRAKVRTSDVLQSTYLEVLSSVQDFRGHTEEAFTHWIVRVLQNNVKDAGKYFKAGKRASDRETGGADLARIPVRDGVPSPSAEAALSEELVLVGRALSRLSEDHRRVILLRLSPRGSHREAARLMDRSEGATRVLLARARAQLLLEVDRLRKGGDD